MCKHKIVNSSFYDGRNQNITNKVFQGYDPLYLRIIIFFLSISLSERNRRGILDTHIIFEDLKPTIFINL